MKDFRQIAFLVMGIAGLIGGLIAYATLSPKPFTDKKQWLKRSLWSSLMSMLGFFVFIIALDLITERVIDHQTIWSLILSMTPYFLVGSIVWTIAIYSEAINREKYTQWMNRLIDNIRTKKK